MYLLLKLVSMLPLRFLQVFGALVGEIVFKCSPTLKAHTRSNLEQAGYGNAGLFYRVGRNTGRQSMESIWVWYRPAEEVVKRVEVRPEVLELIGGAMRSKRPVVFMTPHVGCFEVLPVWLAQTFYKETGRKIAILYRPPKKDILRRIVGEARQAPGIEPCPTTLGGVRRIIRALKAGHTFGALPDQVPSKGEGVWVDFFGRPAYTATLPVKVAKQFGAIKIFAWGVRLNHGWRLEARLWDDPLDGTVEENCRAMNRQMEDIIRSMPEQYEWSYNRYKVPAGAKPPKAKAKAKKP
jgi:KDO2-lipid IV(A) lauroyltransferase